MNKFIKSITSGNNTLAERGALVAKAARYAQEELVRKLESDINSKELEIAKLCDLAPTNTQDTKPTGAAVDNPRRWVETLHNFKVEIELKKRELTIAQNTLKEWFDEDPAVSGQ